MFLRSNITFVEQGRIRQIENHNLEVEKKPLLTDGQIEMLKLAAAGKTNREIAEELGFSKQVIENHFSRRSERDWDRGLFACLDVYSRREAVVKAISLGILDPEKLVQEEELSRCEVLVEHEIEVLRLLSDPTFTTSIKTFSRQVSDELGIPDYTVKNRLNSIYRKLEIKTKGPGTSSSRATVTFLAYQWKSLGVNKEVLRPLAGGFNNDEIARGLGMSKKGVESRIHRLYSKFKINGRSPDARLQLVRKAIRIGCLPAETNLSLFEPPFLTPRQEKVLVLLVLGEENQEIARRLEIAWNTIKNYYNATIFRKLGVETRAELIAKVISEDLVDSNFLKEKFADQIARLETLSPREKEVLRYGVAPGLFNKEIARSLRIPIHIVRSRIGSILKKLGVKNRTQAALIYLLEHPPSESVKQESTSPSHERLRG